MKYLPKTAQVIFKKWGKQGGNARNKRLSPSQRHSIASHAALVRWRKNSVVPPMPSVRLSSLSWKNHVYLEEVLAEGSLSDWRQLYQQIVNYPFGEVAEVLERVVNSVTIYGATRLWKGLLACLQGAAPGA